ncbi:FAD/NAD(P)-binding protein [Streptomyces sp. NRRL F-5126]|uniref:FAD/NAD(P)-binding protein n=1 Tax=Streptomyces sp. NRRL F-5126 TaxID=1463857 RepID=UPI00068CD560|nr:FAD/NAD(P)-binding protein [Streptomyces sp. NRRL F-5126]
MNQASDFESHVEQAAALGRLVVQPRMGMSDPGAMADGLRAVSRARATTVGTLTIDSYTRVEDIDGARRALEQGKPLNGFPIVNHGPVVTGQVAAATGGHVPVQVRHGSARPGHIFETMVQAGLSASEGGPISYCLPYSRLPLSESVPAWADACDQFVETAIAAGMRPHLETFGGCMLGQMCPPALLIAISVLEAAFFGRHGLESVSLSYAQQTHAVQDVEALAALARLAREFLPGSVARHIVLYTYMGVFPQTEPGARLLLDSSARIAVRGGAHRLIVKTVAEAHRIPTVAENVAALERADREARAAYDEKCPLPWACEVDHQDVYTEARALIETVLGLSDDIGLGMRRAFQRGLLDVPFCLHRDNAGQAQGAVSGDGRLVWAKTGAMPLPGKRGSNRSVTSAGLLSMLRHTADTHDRRASELLATAQRTHRIAIVGSGPRGLAVAERLAARLSETPPEHPVEITLIDKDRVGAGRVWRADQPSHFLMNTACGEVTMFSGPQEPGRPARAGAGPSLGQWWGHVDSTGCYPGPNAYAPRALYGDYLEFVLDTITASLPEKAVLHGVAGEVVAAERGNGRGWVLTFSDGTNLQADQVLLATGHPRVSLAGRQAALQESATAHGLTYLRGDSAADMPLDSILPGADVAVLGMGLSFYDVAAALTAGRGGVFAELPDGSLRYRPSGKEPRLLAGSRSGVPVPARGRNQKEPLWRYEPDVFTTERVDGLRARGPMNFRADLWPWLDAEMQLVYYTTAVRESLGSGPADRLRTRTAAQLEQAGPHGAEGILRTAVAGLGLPPLPELDVPALARPFTACRFESTAQFDAALRRVLEDDIAHAALGNFRGPRKAALDVLRDVRGVIRRAVDNGGLTARSHRDDFLAWFVPLSSFLAAGPPVRRLKETLALMDAGILEMAGPASTFATDDATGTYTIASPQVSGSTRHCTALIDARIPGPDLLRDESRLTRQLVGAGTWTAWRNTAGEAEIFEPGGVSVAAASPYRAIGTDGRPADGLYVLGIPCEGQRWFMQVGSARPGPWTEFTRDADDIAAGLLAPLGAPAADRHLEGARS